MKSFMSRFNPYHFWASCLHLTGELVQFITDSERAKQVTYDTFYRHADLRSLHQEKHPALYRRSCKDNWAISYWKSKMPSGIRIYYFDWSGIEHVFVDQDIIMEFELKRLADPLQPSRSRHRKRIERETATSVPKTK